MTGLNGHPSFAGRPSQPLRLAVVGAGWAGLRQVEAAAELDGRIVVTWLADNDPVHLRESAERWAVGSTSGTLDEVLAASDVDAVSICTPHALHAPMAIAAAHAGKHVLVEKPMATTVADASAMISAADEAGVTLFVAENKVYGPRATLLRELLSTGAVGELAFAACVAGYRAPDPGYAGRRAWLTQPEAGGTGTWMLQGVHTVAELRHVLGEVASVYMLDHRTRSFERPDLEATMSGVVVLEGGLVVWLVQTTESEVRPGASGFRIYGDAGILIADDDGYQLQGRDAAAPQVPYPASRLSSYARELEAFADHIAGSAPGPTTGVSERRTLAVIEAGIESARTLMPVDLATRYPELAVDRARA